MCGVIGLICERSRRDMGRIAAELLKTLEYRGYDSTGAAIQDGGRVRLVKGVGAPTVMVDQLGITEMRGSVLCGQVRWATFGAVNDENSQPHEVRCKAWIYGAHNGNVTNCDELKEWLASEGHAVRSDNDGEMVVHTVEHYFARELARLGSERAAEPNPRRAAMRHALVSAAARLEGSYAAVLVDPALPCIWSVKQGSSLYFGLGQDELGGSFTIASSDLSSVLKLTRVVVPLAEGELVEHDASGYQVYAVVRRAAPGRAAVAAGEPLERGPVRSRLRAKDTALVPPFETFMDQEISAQEQTCRNVITLFLGGSEASQVLGPHLEATPEPELSAVAEALDELRDQYDDARIRAGFHALVDSPAMRGLLGRIPPEVRALGVDAPPELLADRLVSSEAGFLADLLSMAREPGRDDELLAVRLMDVLLERLEVAEWSEAVERFVDWCEETRRRGGRIVIVCCGSSFHAAKAAALFFNTVARIEALPLLPGEYRGQHARSLRDGDLFVAVSQSGETKDLIDILNHTIASGRDIRRVALVNNVSSTLAQEKSDLVIPLRCGPEIAVPATKSFMNQMAVLYCLALRLGQRRLERVSDEERAEMAPDIAERLEKLPSLPRLIRETFDSTDAEVEQAAQQLFLAPSIHILATRLTAVAREGALKIREVVLNHTEGFEGSEFKHGPNTILGFNTLFGPREVDALLKKIGELLQVLARRADERGMGPTSVGRLIQAVTDSVFSLAPTPFALNAAERALLAEVLQRSELVDELYADYPLIYVTGPDEQDVHLTVSQINTHKIRGASTVVIAEAHPALRQAASKAPTDNPAYRSVYVTLPRTGDTLMTVFSSTVVLQRLALKMSLLKAAYLDRIGVKDHGVHPDVPKNVSKSITVD